MKILELKTIKENKIEKSGQYLVRAEFDYAEIKDYVEDIKYGYTGITDDLFSNLQTILEKRFDLNENEFLIDEWHNVNGKLIISFILNIYTEKNVPADIKKYVEEYKFYGDNSNFKNEEII